MAQSFRELRVWNRAIDLTMLVYAITAEFPKHELYGLTSQMRRASVAIASNIAEGSGRGTKRDFRQFVRIARGSNCELQTQLVIARRLHYSNPGSISEAETTSHEIGQMLSGLDTYLRAKPVPPPATENGQRRTEN